MDGVDFNPIIFYKYMNINQFSWKIEEKTLGRCKYMYLKCTWNLFINPTWYMYQKFRIGWLIFNFDCQSCKDISYPVDVIYISCLSLARVYWPFLITKLLFLIYLSSVFFFLTVRLAFQTRRNGEKTGSSKYQNSQSVRMWGNETNEGRL